MPVLNWIGKDKVVNHDKDVPFRLLNKVGNLSTKEDSENLIIEGDNLEALKALMPYYSGQVKCIYIDPPYNTGNEKWVYNDKVNSPEIRKWLGKVVGPDGEDLNRHDKWLCMMYPRLKLLKELLREDGGILISIDYNEESHLRILMNEIYGEENYRNTFVVSRVKKNIQEREKVKAVNFGYDVILFYGKSEKCLVEPPMKFQKKDERWHAFDAPGIRPTMEYEIFGKHPPKGRHWMYSKENSQEMIKKGELRKNPKTESIQYLLKASNYTLLDTNWTDIQEYDSDWNFPNGEKNVALIKRVVKMLDEPNSIILDSFAGSGTTGHAVLDLNKEDKGNRKFILVEMESNIAEDITAERLRKVINGYSHNGNKVGGLGGGFQFMRLGTTLFDKDGFISEDVTFKDLAQYIYFTETKTALNTRKIDGLFIGEKNDTEYYLLFKGIKKNVLDNKILKQINKSHNPKIIYADRCLINKTTLAKYKITFKQIPYEVKTY